MEDQNQYRMVEKSPRQTCCQKTENPPLSRTSQNAGSTQPRCPICGQFYRRGHHGRKFCSMQCRKIRENRTRRQKRIAHRVIRQCQICGEKFENKIAGKATCSKSCGEELHKRRNARHSAVRASRLRPLKCVICGTLLERTGRPGYPSNVCSTECRSERKRKMQAIWNAAHSEELRAYDRRKKIHRNIAKTLIMIKSNQEER
jgi:predicted nucleic acid-binding Zn ribbon protein